MLYIKPQFLDQSAREELSPSKPLISSLSSLWQYAYHPTHWALVTMLSVRVIRRGCFCLFNGAEFVFRFNINIEVGFSLIMYNRVVIRLYWQTDLGRVLRCIACTVGPGRTEATMIHKS